MAKRHVAPVTEETGDAFGDSSDVTVEPSVDVAEIRARELRWLDSHPDIVEKLAGQWLALDGDELVSHGEDLAVVFQQAEEAGHPHPFITKVPDPNVIYIY